MNFKSIIISFVILNYTLFMLSGCGYKPSSYYAKNEISGKVYVDLEMDIENSQNSVLVKDAMNEMVLSRFNAQLTQNKEEADTQVFVRLASVSHSVMASDNEGYAKTYRANVTISVIYQKRDQEKKNLSVSNYYDYNVEANSLVSDQQKQEAVKNAATKALGDLFSKIAVNSFKE
ncbi:MAG: hypothetical protein K8R39_01970 [Arcobacteraceae bacterium]|nr:hypothetical protein [Arcobacteraceae bacterium]